MMVLAGGIVSANIGNFITTKTEPEAYRTGEPFIINE
jgi:hypothetical protein